METPHISVEKESAIRFRGDLAEQQDRGQLIALTTIFYRPETDRLELYFPESITEEEAVSMLRKYRCFPK